MKNILPIRLFGMLFCAQFLLVSCWNARAFQIDVTQPPYSATTSTSPGTDNGPAFRSAITALLAAGGGTLYIPSGSYRFTTAIVISGASQGSLIIQGDGPHQQGATGGTDLVWLGTGSTDAITVNGGSSGTHFVLRDLALSGGVPPISSVGTTNHNGVTLASPESCLIDDVLVEGFANYGIYNNYSYYSTIRNTTVASCGVGVYCSTTWATGGSSLGSLINVTAQYNQTAGFYNPNALVSCTIINNRNDGIVYAENSGKYSIRDCTFGTNNTADAQEGADIYCSNTSGNNGSSSVCLSMEGCNTFVHSSRTTNHPYRYLRGGFYYINKSGTTIFPTLTQWAMVNLTKSSFQECSTEHYPSNLTWLAATNISNNYTVWNVAHSIATNPN